MHHQDGAAVRGNGHAGGLVKFGIPLIAPVVVAGQIRGGRGVHRRAHRAGGTAAVIIYERGGIVAVVIFLQHIDDGVVHRPAGPLGVEGGVLGQFNTARDPVAGGVAVRIFVVIPASEGIAVPGGRGVGEIDGAAIHRGRSAHVAAAKGIIGELEALAVVANDQLLAGSLGDLGGHRRFAGRMVENSVGVFLDSRRDNAALYTLDRNSLNSGVTVTGEILELVDKRILSREFDIFDCLCACIVGEIIHIDSEGRLLGIIHRVAGHILLFRLGGSRRCDSVWQVFTVDRNNLSVESVGLPFTVLIIILYR